MRKVFTLARRHRDRCLVILNLLGVDIIGWFAEPLGSDQGHADRLHGRGARVPDRANAASPALSYYGILKFAYKDEVTFWPIAAAYAVGVAMNGFLPANIGTFVTLVMFVAIIPSCGIAGAIAAYLVQKIFFTLAGTFVYLYMFLSVPGAFDISFGRLHDHPLATVLIAAGAVLLCVIVGRILMRKVKGLWEQAKEGGAILSEPKTYLKRVVPAVVPLLELQARRRPGSSSPRSRFP